MQYTLPDAQECQPDIRKSNRSHMLFLLDGQRLLKMAKGKSLWKYTQRCFSSTGRKELYQTCPQDRGGPPSRQDLTPTALRCVKHSVQSVFLLCSKSSEGSVSLTARHKVPVLTHRPCVTTSFLQGLLILFFFFNLL